LKRKTLNLGVSNLYINLRDPITQIMLILIVNVMLIIIVFSLSPKNLRGWKEKLGIETGQDLLIFFIIMGVACIVLLTLIFASLGFVVPIPY